MNDIKKTYNKLLEHKLLKKSIQNFEILKSSFGKSNSQWMESNMAMSAQTPLRNIRHLLARIERSYEACKETEYKLKKLNIRQQIKKKKLNNGKNELEKELINIEIEEIDHKISSAMFYFQGAVKKIRHNYNCIEQIMESNGYQSFDEMDFEKQEEEYHIKTAFNQAIRVARITGKIDVGNQEYLEQCGINPAVAEKEIVIFLILERNQLQESDGDNTTGTLYQFIDNCYKKFKGLSKTRIAGLGVKEGFMEEVMYEVSKEEKKLLLEEN